MTEKEYQKKWYKEHRDERLASMRQYYTKHRDEELAYKKQYYKEHRDEQLASMRQYRKEHRDEMLASMRQYRKEHRDEKSVYNKQWRELMRKHESKRQRSLGFVPLNEWFEGSEAHHIDRERVIYIPKEYHQGIRHNVWTGRNMDEINAVAFNYL